MRIFHTRKQLLAFFMPGFLLGILYVNFAAKKYMAEPGIFSEYFLNQFQAVQIDTREYLWYLLRLRALPFLVLGGLAFTRLRRLSAAVFLIWAGASGGILISTAVLNMGIRGSLLCVTGLLPQFLFYIPAYLVLFWYCFSSPQGKWNRQKTVFIVLCMITGIILELYVNPILVKAFLSTL